MTQTTEVPENEEIQNEVQGNEEPEPSPIDEHPDYHDSIAAARKQAFSEGYAAGRADTRFPKVDDEHPTIKLLQEGHLLHLCAVLSEGDFVVLARVQNGKVHSSELLPVEKLNNKTLTEFVHAL